ncbi:MAG: hypothetical protein HY842_19210 [Bacteroidetes bacterium]|nr:hypothetical protein [Bacteroidota bacterium]
MFSKNSLLFLGSFLLLSACGDEHRKPVFQQNNLIGRWELANAWRNGKQTETLTGTFYEFSEDGSMKTNLTPSAMEAEFPYRFLGNEIRQEGEPSVVYSIDTLTGSTLSMSMTINNFPFRLELQKAQPPVESEAVDSTLEDSVKEL